MIRTERLLLHRFRESDCDDLFEFLSQLEDDEFEGYPGITWENGREYLRQNIYFRGHGLSPYVLAGDGKELAFSNALKPTSTIFVDDLTGDGVVVDDLDDLIVSNKLGDIEFTGNQNSKYYANTSFRKAGKGTMVLANSSYSSATGDIEVVEGKLVICGGAQGIGMSNGDQ